ncbi:MAG: GPW/gp25 family protein [Chloroflexi bacterium]|nr:GPW/gp25 family protein [Chloroflexota bacterium]
MRDDFIGVGWAFPIQVDAKTGRIALARHERDIEEAIRIILGTSPGERVMRPLFGSDLAEAVFSINSATTAARVESYVREALRYWEPRIEVIAVTIVYGRESAINLMPYDPEAAYRLLHNPDTDALMIIDVRYRVRATNDERNLVFPFYTIPGEEAP